LLCRSADIVVRVDMMQPTTDEEALRLWREIPGAVPVAGGTEVMPARLRGEMTGPLLDLSRVSAFRSSARGHELRLGSCVTCTELIERFAGSAPVLAQAARTVGSRQIRNRATLGGALALADPSADVLAGLTVAGASVTLRSLGDLRTVALEDFLTGPFACDLRDGELISEVSLQEASGPSAYAKVGARNAMSRAVAAVAVTVDHDHRRVRIALAAVAPTPVRARGAEALFAAEAPWASAGSELSGAWLAGVGAAAASDASPRADRRGSAEYKRHAAAVLTRRALARAWRAGRA
jgi:CO/xanthine dehydrogenase FAD-binding subunit